MILVLASIIAVFLAGSTCGIFAMLVIGIHAEERRVMRNRSNPSRTESSRAGAVSRRLLTTRTCDEAPTRVPAGR
ncbi:hypothetical protein GCM10009527_015370 [Actinomadura nitritigenes]|uniref:Secreted protein n=1 Tax=Actinomadura nitritigenes TaxID=134602 RepID=A0ABS3QSF1_9ACTN|nr:hypothetical protein [Actinomadura nitritigenes]MBO2436917.1 hypothetical protein [Actinomadura nitritigenes]